MRHQNFSFKKTQGTVAILIVVFIIIHLMACTGNKSEPSAQQADTSVTAKQINDTAAITAIKQFPHLEISRGELKRIFFDEVGEAEFNKMLLNFTIDNYANFPGTLTLVCIGATDEDVPVPGRSVKLGFDREGGRSPLNTANLLYNTNELSETKIKELVMEDNEWRTFDYLIFIPDITVRDGKRYLHYKVQRRPLELPLISDEELTNPCPPNRPNDN